MQENKFDTLIEEFTQEFNEDAQRQIADIKNILNDWEKTIKNSPLSTVELLERHYKSLLRHRISRLKKLLDIDCPLPFVVRELMLCRQHCAAFLESNYAKRIMELRK